MCMVQNYMYPHVGGYPDKLFFKTIKFLEIIYFPRNQSFIRNQSLDLSNVPLFANKITLFLIVH